MSKVHLEFTSLVQKLDFLQKADSILSSVQLTEILSDISPAQLLELPEATHQGLESLLDRHAKKFECILHLVSALEQAGENQPRFKRMALWAQFHAGKLASSDADFKKHFAPYFNLPPSQSLLIAKDLIKQKNWSEAFTYVRRVCEISDDFVELGKASKYLDKIQKNDPEAIQAKNKVRVAVLGGMTTMYLLSVLKACSIARGIELEIYESEYNTIDIEILNPTSKVHEFKPEVVLIMPVEQHLNLLDQDSVENEIERFQGHWQRLENSIKAKVIHLLYDDGAKEDSLYFHRTSAGARRRRIHQINVGLIEAASANTSLIDYEGIVGIYGRQNWHDEKYWSIAKQPVNVKFLPRLARHIIAAIGIGIGRSKRCIAVDLDNTFWGGVVGEEGIHGVKAGQGDGESEEFLAFQNYLLELSREGVVLTAVSKNDESLVKECFEARKNDFAIQFEDFSATRINWLDKAENIRSLSEELALPTEHFVFLDDNPSERNRVRQVHPDVMVPELPLSASGYIREVERHLLFEKLSLTNEDKLRKGSYKANVERKKLETGTSSFSDYLDSLDMVLDVKPLDESVMERAAQLVGKTNQFNLTTKRYSPSQLQEMAVSNEHFPVCFRLLDRFGDYGWIGLVITKLSGETLEIDTWLMSCRVLGKTVEETILEDILTIAKEHSCKKICGQYIPTKKNGLVAKLYDTLGFSTGKNEGEYWLRIGDEGKRQKSHIRRKNLGLN